ncbi:hypothetical protein CDAR_285411 [Caerostris darwini]|uniref:Uncharacterized protein n=1 Tax=Caerostris darwini TaxID=1538125 RepID=A0AAV4RHL2_9ARAC|nr:hypothetical protein CDAR_285411 [Caerostris darwini]
MNPLAADLPPAIRRTLHSNERQLYKAADILTCGPNYHFGRHIDPAVVPARSRCLPDSMTLAKLRWEFIKWVLADLPGFAGMGQMREIIT